MALSVLDSTLVDWRFSQRALKASQTVSTGVDQLTRIAKIAKLYPTFSTEFWMHGDSYTPGVKVAPSTVLETAEAVDADKQPQADKRHGTTEVPSRVPTTRPRTTRTESHRSFWWSPTGSHPQKPPSTLSRRWPPPPGFLLPYAARDRRRTRFPTQPEGYKTAPACRRIGDAALGNERVAWPTD